MINLKDYSENAANLRMRNDKMQPKLTVLTIKTTRRFATNAVRYVRTDH